MLPQLEIATYLPQVFWLFIGFSLVWSFSSFFLLPSIVKNIEKRDEHVRANIFAANEAMLELDKISGLMNTEMMNLASQIRDINDLAKRESIMIRDTKMSSIESEIEDFSRKKMLEFNSDLKMSRQDIENSILFICELLQKKTSIRSLYDLPFRADIVSSVVDTSFDHV